MRSISVKIPTAILISQVEERISEIDREIEEYPVKREQYDKDLEAYHKNVANFVSAYLGKNLDKIGTEHDDIIRLHTTFASRVELTFDTSAIVGFPKKPECPEAPNQKQWWGRNTHATRKELLEKNLRILQMTSQEEVSASTYGAVMELL